MCEPADASPCFTVHLARVTQVLLNAKLSLAAAAAAETGHFLFAPHVSRVIPGELGAGLHDPERETITSVIIRNLPSVTTSVVFFVLLTCW